MTDVEIFTHDKNVKLEGIDDSERTPCECWSRCMGYFRPVSFFNIGKQQEFADRKYFNIKKAVANCVNTIDIKAAE